MFIPSPLRHFFPSLGAPRSPLPYPRLLAALHASNARLRSDGRAGVHCAAIGACSVPYGTKPQHFAFFGLVSPAQYDCLYSDGVVLCVDEADNTESTTEPWWATSSTASTTTTTVSTTSTTTTVPWWATSTTTVPWWATSSTTTPSTTTTVPWWATSSTTTPSTTTTVPWWATSSTTTESATTVPWWATSTEEVIYWEPDPATSTARPSSIAVYGSKPVFLTHNYLHNSTLNNHFYLEAAGSRGEHEPD